MEVLVPVRVTQSLNHFSVDPSVIPYMCGKLTHIFVTIETEYEFLEGLQVVW